MGNIGCGNCWINRHREAGNTRTLIRKEPALVIPSKGLNEGDGGLGRETLIRSKPQGLVIHF